MPAESLRQRKTTGRVMHEFKYGELKSGPGGNGGEVKSRRQAIAIALKEAGASKYESKSENRKNLSRTKRKEARGETAQQEREGKSHVGARDRRENSRMIAGKNATQAPNVAVRLHGPEPARQPNQSAPSAIITRAITLRPLPCWYPRKRPSTASRTAYSGNQQTEDQGMHYNFALPAGQLFFVVYRDRFEEFALAPTNARGWR